MKKKAILLFAICLFLATPVFGSMISINPSISDVSVGGNFSVDLTISGLGSVPLAGWSLYLGYDPAIVGFVSIEFGSFFGSGADVNSYYDDSIAGSLYADTFSYLPDAVLESLQGDSFRLAKLNYIGLSKGTSPLTLFDIAIVNINIEEVIPSIMNGTVYVRDNGGTAPVPEPNTLLLLGSGLCIVAGFARKRQD